MISLGTPRYCLVSEYCIFWDLSRFVQKNSDLMWWGISGGLSVAKTTKNGMALFDEMSLVLGWAKSTQPTYSYNWSGQQEGMLNNQDWSNNFIIEIEDKNTGISTKIYLGRVVGTPIIRKISDGIISKHHFHTILCSLHHTTLSALHFCFCC
jgi:hypothetical protein